jgi:hypothetical protein
MLSMRSENRRISKVLCREINGTGKKEALDEKYEKRQHHTSDTESAQG